MRFRLTALFVGIFGTTLILFSTLLYRGFVKAHQNVFDSTLYNHALDVAAAVDFTWLGQLILQKDVLEDASHKVFPFSLGQALLQIRSLDGRVLISSTRLANYRLPLSESEIIEVMDGRTRFQTLSHPPWQSKTNVPYRLVSTLLSRPPYPDLVLQIAVPMTYLENEKSSASSLLIFFIPLALLLSTIGGYGLANRALAPVNRVIKAARAIAPDRLSERIPVPNEVELKELVTTLNDLLARLERAFQTQERFIADASHQLRTPLAILRGELDVLLSKERDPLETKNFLASASQEIDRLSKMVTDLLLLARVDAGVGSLSFVKLRLDETLLESLTRLSSLAKSKEQQILFNVEETEGNDEFYTLGDPELLRGLFYNLLENAIKYSPPRAKIKMDLAAKDEMLEVTVQDQGPGIPEVDQKKIFDRFYRGGREASKEGMGLGLSIAQRIAEAHGASLDFVSSSAGTNFRLRIKKV